MLLYPKKFCKHMRLHVHGLECIGTHIHNGFIVFQQSLEINNKNVTYCSFRWHGVTVGPYFDAEFGLLSV